MHTELWDDSEVNKLITKQPQRLKITEIPDKVKIKINIPTNSLSANAGGKRL